MGIDAEMFVRTREPITDEQVCQWSWELASAFGERKFWIWGRDKTAGFSSVRHALHRVESVDEDSQVGELYPSPGEMFLRTHPATRFYGKGYERGDLPFLLALADWLRMKVPGGEVWYGGDSSGVRFRSLDTAYRDELWSHFVAVGHQPYVGGFGRRLGTGVLGAPVCDFCGGVPMTQYGFGGLPGNEWRAFHCSGCGYDIESRGAAPFTERPRQCPECERPYKTESA